MQGYAGWAGLEGLTGGKKGRVRSEGRGMGERSDDREMETCTLIMIMITAVRARPSFPERAAA